MLQEVINISTYILLALSVSCAFFNNITIKKFSNKGLDGLRGVLAFNSLASCVWIVILLAKGIVSGLSFGVGALLWGLLYGLVSAAFLLCKMQALSTGPVSLTAFIGCSSLLISTAFGVFVLREGATLLQWLGVGLLCVSLFLISAPKTGSAEKSWKFWCAAFFVCSAVTGIIFKLQQRSESASEVDEMLIVSAVTAALIFGLTAIFLPRNGSPEVPVSALPYALLCGVFACVYNRLNVNLSGLLPCVIFFPVFNGSVIILSTLAGVILFKERLKRSQIIGMIIGSAALMLASGCVG